MKSNFEKRLEEALGKQIEHNKNKGESNPYPQHSKVMDIREAKNDKADAEAILELIKDNDLACTVEIGEIKIGLCLNIEIKNAIEKHIQEIDKYLNGQENEWE